MTTTKLGVMPEDIDLFAEISRHNQENNIQTYHLKKKYFPSVDSGICCKYI